MDEQALLGAIASSPRDAALRLVYADWLEERGDVRGELVRVEEEMRTLPAYSDRFWELKAWRNELRALAAPGWLEVMGYGTEAWPLFGHGVPDGWRERWRLVRELVERWHGRPMPDVGGGAEEVREVEERLGRALPPSVREYVAFAHDLNRGADHFIVLRDFYRMQELELSGQPAVSLLLQGEGDLEWAVHYDDFARADPPVYAYWLDMENNDYYPEAAPGGGPLYEGVSAFALEYALNYTRGAAGGFGAVVPEPAALIRDLEATFPAQGRFRRLRFFEADNILVRLEPVPQPPAVRIVVEVAREMPREALPAALRGCPRGGGWSHGMFDPGPIPGPAPGEGSDDEIPF